MSVLISVIMPVYNASLYLEEAINSVINQSFDDWELLCVDDGSTDDSLSILERYAKLDDRIKVFKQPNSGTASGARNTALKYATGDYIHILDSDDVISKDCLSKAYGKVVQLGADVVIPDAYFFNDNISNTSNSIIGVRGDRDLILSGREAFSYSIDWTIHAWVLIKTSILQNIGGYDVNGINGDEYTARVVMLNADKVCFTDAKYFYRQHDKSTTKKLDVEKQMQYMFNQYRLCLLVDKYKFPMSARIKAQDELVQCIHRVFLMVFDRGFSHIFSLNTRVSLVQSFIKNHKSYSIKNNVKFFIFRSYLLSLVYSFCFYLKSFMAK